MSGRDSVFVEAAARLHFGVLDLRGGLGRRFGGLGAAVPTPSLLLEATPEAQVTAHGPDARGPWRSPSDSSVSTGGARAPALPFTEPSRHTAAWGRAPSSDWR